MIALIFLAAGLTWLAFSWFLARKIPRWLALKTVLAQWATSVVVMALLLFGPFVDEIIGMRQFEKLCHERATVWTADNAKSVTRVIKGDTKYNDLTDYWIPIKSQQIEYLNAVTGERFLAYEILHTRGGRVARMVLLSGDHSCSPPAPNAMNYLDIDKLIKQEWQQGMAATGSGLSFCPRPLICRHGSPTPH